MTNIIRAFWGALAVVALLWGLATPDPFSSETFLALRNNMVQLSGLLAMACMSLAMILALRPRLLERPLGGLDKMYRLHKWFGIGALVLAVTHWFWTQAPKWGTGIGLMQRGPRPPRPPVENPVEAAFLGLRHTAEGLGEWAFYGAVMLIVVALVTRIPYRWFQQIHRLFPVAYLVLVFHAVMLFDFDIWLTPAGALLVLLLVGGSGAALVSIFGAIGRRRRVEGRITSLVNFPGVRALETVIAMQPGWPGHRPGQFAFAVTDRREGAHPYTIASAWNPAEPEIRFVTKELGDHTTGLAEKLHVGQQVRIEGPYGCFTFDDACPAQIWVGGGIGITPFIARMKALAQGDPKGAEKEVHLFHCTADVDEGALDRLRADAAAAGVTLHILIDARDGVLTGARIRREVPGWREASLWFCGPTGFGRALRADFAAEGLKVGTRFHQELFAMR